MTVADGYHRVQPVVVPESGGTGHVDYLQISALLHVGWTQFLVPGLGLARDDVFAPHARPIVRSVTGRFDAEVRPGAELRCGTRGAGRSRRSFTLEGALWTPEGRIVAVGTVVLVTIDTATGRAVEVPDALWSAVERGGTSP